MDDQQPAQERRHRRSDNYGQAKLPPKAERVYGSRQKSDHTAMYLDREGKVQTVHFRMPEAEEGEGLGSERAGDDEAIVVAEAPSGCHPQGHRDDR